MAALPSLRQLRYLLALAEHLNFTRAAEASFVSQSTLSTGLKELESILGVQLVERDKQTVALTAVGKEVVARARQVLAAAEDLSDFASDASRPMQGQLRLGVIPTIAPFVLPTVMPALREKFPQLQLALREDLTAHLLERLRDRQLDFALIALPYDTDDLRVQSLYKDKFWLVGLSDGRGCQCGRNGSHQSADAGSDGRLRHGRGLTAGDGDQERPSSKSIAQSNASGKPCPRADNCIGDSRHIRPLGRVRSDCEGDGCCPS
jgi:DNA-binding transcriptional LysR family regulator